MTEPPLNTLIVELTYDAVAFGRDLPEWLIEPSCATGAIAADDVGEYLEDLALLSVTAPLDLLEHHSAQLRAVTDAEGLARCADWCMSSYACVLPVASLEDVDIESGVFNQVQVAVVVLTPLTALTYQQQRTIADHVRVQVGRDPEHWHDGDVRSAMWTSEPTTESFDGTFRDEAVEAGHYVSPRSCSSFESLAHGSAEDAVA